MLAAVLALLILAAGFNAGSPVDSSISLGEKTMDMFLPSYKELTLESGNSSKRIAVLDYDGIIGDDSYFYNFMNSLENIRKDSSVKGVIMRINSPGGGVYESKVIKDKILQLKKENAVKFYTVMGSAAASGGYYISSPSDSIYASSETITGSIGVILSYMNYGALAEKYGVQNVVIKSGKNKDMGSSFSQMTNEQRQIFQTLIDNSYERFLDTVASGRNMSKEKVRKLADGRVYDGSQALAAGLIDKLGYYDDALGDLKKELKLHSPEVFTYEYKDGLNKFIELLGMESSVRSNAEYLTQLSQKNAPRLMYLYGGM